LYGIILGSAPFRALLEENMAPSRIPRWQLILYSSGSLATAVSYQAFATYIQFLYIDVYGLRAAWVGIVWSLYGLWNAINDPLVGYLSDRTHTRWGRRIPWIAGAFIPLSISLYLLFVPPAGMAQRPDLSLLFYFMFFVLLFDMLWTIVVMSWTALFPEMVPDEKQRANVSAWRQIFSVIGLLIGVALPPLIAGADWSNVGSVAMMIAVVTAVFFGISLIGSRERPEFAEDEPLPFKESIRATITNRNFLIFLGTNLMIQFVFLAITSTLPFYTKYALHIQTDLLLPFLGITLDVATQNSLFLGLAFIVALPAMPGWAALTHRWGAWKTLRACTLSTAVILLGFFLTSSFYTGLLVVILFGASIAGLLMLTDLLIADLVDEDELKTGARREGLYFGMNGFVIRLAFTIQGVITAVVLTATRYVAPTEGILYPVQPPAAVFGFRLMAAGIPALALVLGYFLLGKYSLHGGNLVEMRTAVSHLHAQKRDQLQT
jgi:GPH family glycoside/pentoside/hexuronide:cation symporter